MAAGKPQVDDHPSAARAATRLASLLYGLIAAPAAWIVSQILCSALAQEACFPKYQPLASPAFSGLQASHGAALLVAVGVSASGAVVAFGAWRATHAEHRGGSGTLLDVGEGRSRFMAFAGILTSLGFMLGSLFSIPAVLFVPPC